ncbi:MAG: hypothetical protein HZA54_09025 [Planctomycetes bacterium]|nr:hypothetical protein [Planctomycetota bacterium]
MTVPAARIESTACVVLVSRTRTRMPRAFEDEDEDDGGQAAAKVRPL